MNRPRPLAAALGTLLVLALSAPGSALAYGTEDAIRDCEEHGGQRWCRVSMRDAPDVQGWVNGHYLRESSN